MAKKSEKPAKKTSPISEHAGLLFVGLFLTGMGLGGFFDAFGAGALLGLGAAFLSLYWSKTRA